MERFKYWNKSNEEKFINCSGKDHLTLAQAARGKIKGANIWHITA